jgi:cytochrome c biogenesis protein CcdA
MIPALLSGLLAGSLHVISGPDHLAALGPIAAARPGVGWRSGIRWGVGHSSGVAVIGILALAFREALPLEAMSAWAEHFVGVVLIGIGIVALRGARRRRVHAHPHRHDDERHVHFHVHGQDQERHAEHRHERAAFGVGVIHGLAGSSHFLGVLPALAFPHRAAALAYLLAYGVGSILTMGAFGSLLDRTVSRVGTSGESAYRKAMTVLGSIAILVGLWWILR